ncbi:MAG: hypothetical protein HOL04_08175 [Gammaproteobacteria bacterium]|jgi:hypothetical protein|nr:hypothetical protein [Gammaproteobacteria bacterium]MBT4811088.1 hypothetical protein [Thiotrichales bacterium]MBT3472190.1 hypothetical protein [Gammaproteobacteria bacterium]MBT3965987.1 hypothetical protein [Gammaproteobacteria bacterium]MBT4079911.1 hypothetical protein [Gammaproteobacteria bacterium]
MNRPPILLLLLLLSAPLQAKVSDYTPTDVYAEAEWLQQQVLLLRKINQVTTPYPLRKRVPGKAPRHVLQKGLEVLEKLNRLRQIDRLGAITIPPFPARQITPNEVYVLMVRLGGEAALILQEKEQNLQQKKKKMEEERTPSDVYRLLHEISDALNPVIGVRGVTPPEVYALSERVLDNVRFLRTSQNRHDPVEAPQQREGQLSNHALQSAVRFDHDLAELQYNLWIEPMQVLPAARRKISPTDVYDRLLNTLAELQRTKYRLGLERNFDSPLLDLQRTPDDVVYNMELAQRLLPDLRGNERLQFASQTLHKRPEHVYAVVSHALVELNQYQQQRGIVALPEAVGLIELLEPRHVYFKALDVMEQLSQMREQHNMGRLALPDFPQRAITPDQVYDLAIRLDVELELLYRKGGMEEFQSYTSELGHAQRVIGELTTSRTPSEVYQRWGELGSLIRLLSGRSAKAADINRRLRLLQAELELISAARGVQLPSEDCCSVGVEQGSHLQMVEKAVRAGKQLYRLHHHVGLLDSRLHSYASAVQKGRQWVMDELGILLVNSRSIKQHLGIAQLAEVDAEVVISADATALKEDNRKRMRQINALLQRLLGEGESVVSVQTSEPQP